MWAGERGGTLCGVVGAGHDDGSGARDGGEGGWEGTCGDVWIVVGCGSDTDDDGWVASGDAGGRGVEGAKGRGVGGWAERGRRCRGVVCGVGSTDCGYVGHVKSKHWEIITVTVVFWAGIEDFSKWCTAVGSWLSIS